MGIIWPPLAVIWHNVLLECTLIEDVWLKKIDHPRLSLSCVDDSIMVQTHYESWTKTENFAMLLCGDGMNAAKNKSGTYSNRHFSSTT